jgi:hypothetical protein
LCQTSQQHDLRQRGGEVDEIAERRRATLAGRKPLLVMACRSRDRCCWRLPVTELVLGQQVPVATRPSDRIERAPFANQNSTVAVKLVPADQVARRLLTTVIPMERHRGQIAADGEFDAEYRPRWKRLAVEPRCLHEFGRHRQPQFQSHKLGQVGNVVGRGWGRGNPPHRFVVPPTRER